MDESPVVQRLKTLRGEGSAADGLVRAEVDGTGHILDLVFDPAALRMSPNELADAVKAAVGQAQDAAQSQAADALAGATPGLPDRDGLAATLSELGVQAERRMSEFSTAMYDLLRQVERR